MNRKVIVKQHGNKDCGVAALLSIIRYYGGNVSYGALSEMLNVSNTGTTFADIQDVSYKFNIDACGYYVEQIDSVRNVEPFIAQVIRDNYSHFVVVYKISKTKVTLMDPSCGKRVISHEEFFKEWTHYIMMFELKNKVCVLESNNKLINLMVKVLLSNKKLISNIIVLSILTSILSCLYSFYMKIIVDKYDISYKELYVVSMIFGLLLILKVFFGYCRNQLLVYLNERIDVSLVIDSIKKILSLPYSYYKNRSTGEIVSRINDLSFVKEFITKMLLTVFLDVLLFIISSIILFTINKNLFMIIILVSLIYLLIIIITKTMIKKYIKNNLVNYSKYNAYLIESITGYSTIKGLNIKNKILLRIEKLYTKYLNGLFNYQKFNNILSSIKELIYSIGILMTIGMGFSYVKDGIMTVGELFTFYSLVSLYLSIFQDISENYLEFEYANMAGKRINELLEIDNEESRKNDLVIDGNIRFNNLVFSYGRRKIIDKFNLDINMGDNILIMGESGSGKSTILKTIMKFYEVDRGMIYINNYDICDLSIDNVRENIGYLSQEEYLFNDTIRNNIMLGNSSSEDKFLNVCKLTGVTDIVDKYKLGYDLMLEEDGSNISGGERARIIMARMLLRNYKVILIDEGLSEVDINLERKILENIFNNFKEVTFIIVSHRRDNMDLFKRFIRIEKGILMESITQNG